MQFKRDIHDICRRAAAEHGTDIETATRAALVEIQARPDYAELAERLVQQAVQGLIYQHRHSISTAIKKNAGCYGQQAKVVVGNCDAVNAVYNSVYQYRIAGTILGELTGEELRGIATKEEQTAQGHMFNVRLMHRLQPLVGPQQLVRNAVTEKRLSAIFAELQGQKEV